MERLIKLVAAFLLSTSLHTFPAYSQEPKEEMHPGKFKPYWTSLAQYEIPEWFRDAKFGIWAHWGPQCQPEQGDWYARNIYVEGSRQYGWHLENYGHPSEFGFKDVINIWKTDEWNPEKLLRLYKKAGARYFFAMGNHHDNLDLWDSKYQEWNSVKLGPEKNILEEWANAARNNALPFGVSIHSAHAWRWYESAQLSDREGPFAGVPYDGRLTAEDGNGKWWEGLDPQKLYAQNHPLSEDSWNPRSIGRQWDWGNGAYPPSEEYCINFYNRTIDMINKFQPDLVYFDDTALPLWPVSEVGLEIAAHYYNQNIALNKGELKAVLFGKILTGEQKECLVWDIERGAPDDIQDKAWQTCTCIGNWHYNRAVYENDGYKSAKTVVQMLADIVSKNGNLLLSIPLRGNGTIDDKAVSILQGIGEWMDLYGDCIYGTRPWHIYGEGPDTEADNPLQEQGFNEKEGGKYTSRDIRFTRKDDVLYAIVMDFPANDEVVIKSLSKKSPYYSKKFKKVQMPGNNNVSYKFGKDGLKIRLPDSADTNMPVVFKIY